MGTRSALEIAIHFMFASFSLSPVDKLVPGCARRVLREFLLYMRALLCAKAL